MASVSSAAALLGYPPCPRMDVRERATAFEDDERRWRGWMEQAASGDADAYQKLMSELCEAVEAYLRARFGAAPFVEDCVQESLLAVHRARASYDPRRPFRAWLFAIVRHKAVDLLRRREVRGRFERASPDAAGEGRDDRAPDPAARLDAAKLLAQLEPKYREALTLTKLEGRSLEDAARHAGISVGAMKTRVHRAVRAVRDALEREEGTA